MTLDRRLQRELLRPDRAHAGVTSLGVSVVFAAAVAASLVLAVPTLAGSAAGPEKTKLRVVALKAPTRVRLDHPFTVSLRVTNRGSTTAPTVAARVSVGSLPDPGFKIKWASARSGALKAGASRSFSFPITISSRYDKEHTDKVSGQTLSFYGAGNYVIEACTGLIVSSDEGCRETATITAA